MGGMHGYPLPYLLTESPAQQMLWVFLLTFGLICLPASFRD